MQGNNTPLYAAGTVLGTSTTSGYSYDRLVNLLNYLVGNALLFGGIIAMAMVVFYGFQMAMSRGDAAKFTTAKGSLIKALIGGVLIFGAYTIINTVRGAASTLTN